MECPKCKHQIHLNMTLEEMIFCPYCEQRMVEPQEGSVTTLAQSAVYEKVDPVEAETHKGRKAKKETHHASQPEEQAAVGIEPTMPATPAAEERARPTEAMETIEAPALTVIEAAPEPAPAMAEQPAVREEKAPVREPVEVLKTEEPAPVVEIPGTEPVAEPMPLALESVQEAVTVMAEEPATQEGNIPLPEPVEVLITQEPAPVEMPVAEVFSEPTPPEILVEAENEEMPAITPEPEVIEPHAVFTEPEHAQAPQPQEIYEPTTIKMPAFQSNVAEETEMPALAEKAKATSAEEPTAERAQTTAPPVEGKQPAPVAVDVRLNDTMPPQNVNEPLTEESVFCTNCGQKLTADYKFCFRCGKAVVTAATPAPKGEVKPDQETFMPRIIETAPPSKPAVVVTESRAAETRSAPETLKTKPRAVPAYYKRPQSFTPARENISEAMADHAPSLPHFPTRKKEPNDILPKAWNSVKEGWGALIGWLKDFEVDTRAFINSFQKPASAGARAAPATPMASEIRTRKKRVAPTKAEVQTTWTYVIIAALVFVAVFVVIGLLMSRG
jgi:hypothetical protein